MKRHHRAMAADIRTGSGDRPPGRTTAPLAPAASEITIRGRAEPEPLAVSRAPLPRSARASGTHTLVLIGELDHTSTHMLEAEIERLCAAGIGAITLDLSKLTGIDPAGVAVIAFRSRWCRKRGCELALIPGPSPVQRAFERAGVVHALTFTDEEAGAAN
jgi:anti-anti-sigma factor